MNKNSSHKPKILKAFFKIRKFASNILVPLSCPIQFTYIVKTILQMRTMSEHVINEHQSEFVDCKSSHKWDARE